MLALLCVCGCAQKPKPKATHPTLAVVPGTTGTIPLTATTSGAALTSSGTVVAATPSGIVTGVTGVKDDDDCQVDDRTCDPVSQGVYDVMSRRFGSTSDYGRVGVWIDQEYGSDYARQRYEGILAQVKAVETWADKLRPGRTRSAYLATAESYEQALNESLHELQTGTYKHEMEEFERHQRECERATRAYKAKHKIPEPPQ